MSAMFSSLSDHLDGTGIAGHLVVRGKQRDIFDLRLRYEYAVEGVFVNQRQRPDSERVFRSNLKFAVVILYQSVPQLPWVNAKVVSAKCALDDDLPNACGAEHQLRSGVAEKILSFR